MNRTLAQVRAACQDCVTAALAAHTADVKEFDYQQTNYACPCARYSAQCEPDECGDWRVMLMVSVWSEQPSSIQTTQMADALVAGMHQRAYSNGTVRLQALRLLNVQRPVRGEDRLWRGEVNFTLLATAA